MRNIRWFGTLALGVLLLNLNLGAQEEVGVNVIGSTDTTGKVVEGMRVGAVTGSGVTATPPNFPSLPPCTAVTSKGGKKNHVAKFTSPCDVENSTVLETPLKGGTYVHVRDAFAVDATNFGGKPFIVMGGCSTALGAIAIGNTLCTSYAVGSDGTNTFLNAPSSGAVSILVGTKGPLASFSASGGSQFNSRVFINDDLRAGNGGFQVDGSGNVNSSGRLQTANGSFTVDRSGNVAIAGNLNVNGQKNFQIDDPLDPANRYLYHSAVESSEMMNIYTGNVITNELGEATVQVPVWFEALNGDFRYQLTVIGQFARAIVASEIRDSKFSIKTDKPNVKVSWQISGVRQDAYAKAHPLFVEQDKQSSERGYYLHPELFGQPATQGINYARQHPAPVKEAEAGRAGQVN
jgi:hypothetical protein